MSPQPTGLIPYSEKQMQKTLDTEVGDIRPESGAIPVADAAVGA